MKKATFILGGVAVVIALVIKYLTRPQTELDIMARTIWGEARGDGYDGMVAVANVINNRAKIGGWWGNSIVAVCLADKQFSAWNIGDPNLQKMLDVDISDPFFKKAVEIATGVLSGSIGDNTDGATHYHTLALKPNWADSSKVVAEIGNHKFYRGIA